MKNRILLTALSVALALPAFSQKVISNGFPGVGVVDGTNYTRTGTIGTQNYAFVTASGNTGLATSVWTSTLYFIDMTTETIVDSMKTYVQDIEARGDTAYAISNSYIKRIKISTRTLIDSVMVSSSPYRLELRPGKSEVWISDSTQMYVVDFSGALNVTNFRAGIDQYDNSPIRFTTDGATAYIPAALTHRIYKIDADTKTITDSVDIPGGNNSCAEVTADMSKLFISNPNDFKIYVVKTSDMSIMDSIDSPREPFEIFRHPTRDEMWCVNHFDDSLTVYKVSDYSEVAAFDLPSGPHNIAFVEGSVSIQNINTTTDISIYPNPANGVLTVALENSGSVIRIYNTLGVELLKETTNSNVTNIDITNIPSGTYFINIEDKNGNISNKEFIKL